MDLGICIHALTKDFHFLNNLLITIPIQKGLNPKWIFFPIVRVVASTNFAHKFLGNTTWNAISFNSQEVEWLHKLEKFKRYKASNTIVQNNECN
jgi:hypothetical protein